MKAISVFIFLIIIAHSVLSLGCSNLNNRVITENNKEEIIKKVANSRLSDDDKSYFASGISREVLAESFNLEEGYSTIGKTVKQIINEQKEYERNKKAEEEARTQAEKEARERYQEELKKAKSVISVTLLNKKNYDEDIWAGRYSPYVNIAIEIKNKSGKGIRGVKGITKFIDIFGDPIITIGLSYDEKVIPPDKTHIYYCSFEINKFEDKHELLWAKELKDLKFEFEPTHIIFDDGSEIKLSDIQTESSF